MAVTGGHLALPQWPHHCKGGAWYHTSMVVRMTLLTTERLFWHCGAHTAEPKLGMVMPIPYY